MLEQKLLAALMDSREAYEKAAKHIVEDELSPQGKIWLPYIVEWYAGDPAASRVDREVVAERGKRQLPEKHRETLLGYWKEIPESCSPANVVTDLIEMRRFSVGNRLCAAIQSVKKPQIKQLLEEYGELLGAETLGKSVVRWTEDDQELRERLSRDKLIKLYPQSLNQRCKGGAARGDHIVVFGRPESGKTMFTVNMVSGFLRQSLLVLYIGNEEDTYKTRKRIICNLASCTPEQFDADTDRVLEMARARGLDRLRICHMTPGSVPEIEEIVKEVRPDVLVIDQIRNLTAKGDSMTVKLERLGIDIRAILGKYDMLGVSITQARDSEHNNKEWLLMEDMDSSRTGLPGQADLIVGVGVSQQLIDNNQRAISLCKNKLNDDPEGRHGFIVTVDPSRSKVR